MFEDSAFRVPQPLRYEDNVLSIWNFNLTVRQVVYVTMLVVLPCWQIYKSMGGGRGLRLVICAPVAALGLFLSFYEFEGKAMDWWAVTLIAYLVAPKQFSWRGVSSNSLAQRIQARKKGHSIPVKRISDGLLELDDGSFRLIMRVSTLNYGLASNDQKAGIFSAWKAALSSMPVGYPIQVFMVSGRETLERYIKSLEERAAATSGKLKKEVEYQLDFARRELRTGNTFQRGFYLVLGHNPAQTDALGTEPILTQVWRSRRLKKGESRDVARATLHARAKQVQQRLERVPLECELVDTGAMMNLLFGLFNPRRGEAAYNISNFYEDEEVAQFLGTRSEFAPGEVLPPRFLVRPEYVQVAERYVRTFLMVNWPGIVRPGWLQPLLDHPDDLFFSMHIRPLDTAKVKKRMERSLGRMTGTKMFNSKKGAPKDVNLDTKSTDTEWLLEELARSQEDLFKVGMYVAVAADSLEELESKSRELTILLQSMQLTPAPARWMQAHGFVTVMPLGVDRLERCREMPTSTLAVGFPFASSSITSGSGVCWGINPTNRSCVLLDRWKLKPNGNGLVFGSSGGGKSFTIKELSYQAPLTKDVEVTVCDPDPEGKGEYRAVCEALGGLYMSFGIRSDFMINPLDPLMAERSAKGEEAISLSVKEALPFLALVLEDTEYSRPELLRVLKELYERAGGTPPILSDLQDLCDERNLPQVALSLDEWTTGLYKGLFNGQTTLPRRPSPYTVYDIGSLEDRARAACMQVITGLIWKTVRGNPKLREFYIDELWTILRNDHAASYIENMVRHCRKFGLAMTVADQQLDDVLSNKYTRALVDNSTIKCIMRIVPESIDGVAQLFHLSDIEKRRIVAFEPGEGLFFLGSSHVEIKVPHSEHHYQLMHTSPEEAAKVA